MSGTTKQLQHTKHLQSTTKQLQQTTKEQQQQKQQTQSSSSSSRRPGASRAPSAAAPSAAAAAAAAAPAAADHPAAAAAAAYPTPQQQQPQQTTQRQQQQQQTTRRLQSTQRSSAQRSSGSSSTSSSSSSRPPEARLAFVHPHWPQVGQARGLLACNWVTSCSMPSGTMSFLRGDLRLRTRGVCLCGCARKERCRGMAMRMHPQHLQWFQSRWYNPQKGGLHGLPSKIYVTVYRNLPFDITLTPLVLGIQDPDFLGV